MSVGPSDPQTLYRSILRILEQGLRTATYKLATMTAIVDFCVSHGPTFSGLPVDVPIPDLAARVLALYWPQTRPFDGVELRQSTASRSRIIEAVNAVRTAAGSDDPDLTIEAAAQQAPEAYRRSLGAVTLCLAQQPLPRLQRLPGATTSHRFLFDDSFLNDNVSWAELERHKKSIRLRPGVADSLATLAPLLRPRLQGMWVDDVLRINRLPKEVHPRLKRHLFGSSNSSLPDRVPESTPAVQPQSTATSSGVGVDMASFASRLHRLIERERAISGITYSSGEIAAKLRQLGLPLMSVTAVTRMKAGFGPPPSEPVIKALAQLFGVQPDYFLGTESTVEPPTPSPDLSVAVAGSAPASTPAATTQSSSQAESNEPEMTWGRVIGEDLAEIAAACKINSEGCWVAPSNSPVRCRPEGDSRDAIDLPKMPLHRWAWIVSKRLTPQPIPPHLVQIHRRCLSRTCCNPEHLYPAAPGGNELTDSEVVGLLTEAGRPPQDTSRTRKGEGEPPPSGGRLVLIDELESVRAHCTTDVDECWIAPTTAPVACRASGDTRAENELSQLAFHRWVWMLTHGHARNPLPGWAFHVRRRCGKTNCCNPDHLYLALPNGNEVLPQELERWLQATRRTTPGHIRTQPEDVGQSANSSREVVGGKHRADSNGGDQSRHTSITTVDSSGRIKRFAERLNRLFETTCDASGNAYSTADVAAALQEEGLAVSSALIDRLRQGIGEYPNDQTVEALAYFFNIDAEYFAAGAHFASTQNENDFSQSAVNSEQKVITRDSPTSDNPDSPGVTLTAAELGRVISGLADVATECLSRGASGLEVAERLLLLLTDLGHRITQLPDTMPVDRELVQRIADTWADAESMTTTHSRMLRDLTELVDDSPDYRDFR
ncbi:HNH nuclease [Mycolicibacterium phlei]|nr:Nucleoid-associated protein EspR [Mycolicibacterium phlei]STZ16499.1 HNH nuclease [Mycolicibacterium phlei]VEG08051.1 HNH nuclease [Mycobacteroides chelonae]